MRLNTTQESSATIAAHEARRRRLNDERMAQALNLLEEGDSVELKLTVPDSDQASAIAAFDMDPLDAHIRQVVFFDTPDLRLNHAGLVVRARRTGTGGDTLVKLRPIVPVDLPRKLRRSKGFSIEVDALPGTFTCSGSLKSDVDNSDVKRALDGKRPIRKLFERKQRALYEERAPRGLDLDSLTALGPITVAKSKFSPPSLRGRSLVAELWFYPDGSRILELSTKCTRDDTFEVLMEARALLTRRGVSLTGEQQTKTRRALDYFAHLHTNGSPHQTASRRRTH